MSGALPNNLSELPGQPGVEAGAILALAGRAAHLEAARRAMHLSLP
jgi:hypothetical protein